MGEWHAFLGLLRAPHSDVLVLLLTFALTVVVNLTVAVQVGVVLAALLFVKRMGDVTQVAALSQMTDAGRNTTEGKPDHEVDSLRKRSIPAGVEVYEVQGTLLFGADGKMR